MVMLEVKNILCTRKAVTLQVVHIYSRQVVIATFSIKTDVSEYEWILTGTNKHHMKGAKTSSDACKHAYMHACMHDTERIQRKSAKIISEQRPENIVA